MIIATSPIPSMHKSVCSLCTFVLLAAPLTSLAFVDTAKLEESINSLEQNLSNEGSGLNELLDQLNQVSDAEDAENFLQVPGRGSATTMWDVPKSAWFFSYVETLTDIGIVSGYKDAAGKLTGKYGPSNNVTHAEALKIAIGAAGIDPATCTSVLANPKAKGHWAESYVRCAEERNFGVTSQTKLDAPASRAEVLHYILMAFKITVPDGAPPFSDSVMHRYKNDIAYAYALEIVSGDMNANGTEKGTFRPNDPVNRAEAAKIVTEAMGIL